MKTKLIIALFVIGMTANAQSFQKGQVDINLGYGIGNTFIDSKYDVTLPGASLALDLGIGDAVSLGVYVAQAKAEWKVVGTDVCNNGNGNGNFSYTYEYAHKASHLIVAIRAGYHLIKADKLDGYAGILLGNNFETDEYTINTNPFCDKLNKLYFDNKYYDGFKAALYAGARYRFTNNIGIFGELGYGIVVLNIGLNVKF